MASSCQQTDEWFDQSLEGTLSPRDARELRRHLDDCPRCRRRFEREQRAVFALHALTAECDAVSADVAGRVGAVMDRLPAISPQVLGQVAQVVRQATGPAADADLRRRLRADPRGTLEALGLALPPGLRIEAVAEWPAPLPTPDTLVLPLPDIPLQIQEVEERLAAMGLGSLFGVWW